MALKYCAGCAHVFNALYDASLTHYTPAYDNSLHFSPRFNQYAAELAERLVDRYGLHGKTVVEIGCGKGEFLKRLCEQGDCRGWGFDRSFDPDRIDEEPPERIHFVQEFYTSEHADRLRPDFLCCRHVLEHIADPRAFLDGLRQTFGNRTDAALYFEMPNALFTLKDMGIWDLIYEHCAYFTLSSLTKLMTSSGFDVLAMGETFGGQFIFIEMRPGIGRIHEDLPEAHQAMTVGRYAGQFAEHYRNKLQSCRERLAELKERGRTAVVWGGGSKGVTFLNALGAKSGIDYVVDVNPHKQGKYVAGTGQLVVSPEFLCKLRPTDVMVMNPIYIGEIAASIAGLGLDTSLHCV
jgi:hypothetical protein